MNAVFVGGALRAVEHAHRHRGLEPAHEPRQHRVGVVVDDGLVRVGLGEIEALQREARRQTQALAGIGGAVHQRLPVLHEDHAVIAGLFVGHRVEGAVVEDVAVLE
ncbi:MAG: hypothetical protein ACK559_25505, partial [bacterium]